MMVQLDSRAEPEPRAQPNTNVPTGGAEPRLTSGGIAVVLELMVVAHVALAIHSEVGSLGGLVRNPKALTLN